MALTPEQRDALRAAAVALYESQNDGDPSVSAEALLLALDELSDTSDFDFDATLTSLTEGATNPEALGELTAEVGDAPAAAEDVLGAFGGGGPTRAEYRAAFDGVLQGDISARTSSFEPGTIARFRLLQRTAFNRAVSGFEGSVEEFAAFLRETFIPAGETPTTFTQIRDAEIERFREQDAKATRAAESDAKKSAKAEADRRDNGARQLRQLRREKVLNELTRIGFLEPTSSADRLKEASDLADRVVAEVELREQDGQPTDFDLRLKTTSAQVRRELVIAEKGGGLSAATMLANTELMVAELAEKRALQGLSEEDEAALLGAQKRRSSLTQTPLRLTAQQLDEVIARARELAFDRDINVTSDEFDELMAEAQDDLFGFRPGEVVSPGVRTLPETGVPAAQAVAAEPGVELAPGETLVRRSIGSRARAQTVRTENIDISAFGFERAELSDRDFLDFVAKRSADVFGGRQLQKGGLEQTSRFVTTPEGQRVEVFETKKVRSDFDEARPGTRQSILEAAGLSEDELVAREGPNRIESFGAFRERVARSLTGRLREGFAAEQTETREREEAEANLATQQRSRRFRVAGVG